MTSFLTGLASVLSGGVREHFPLIRVKNIYQTKHCRIHYDPICYVYVYVYLPKIHLQQTQKLTMTQKVEDMASEFLLTFLAVLVQLGLPARQNQTSSGKELGSGYAFHRSEMHFDFKTIFYALLNTHFFCQCD